MKFTLSGMAPLMVRFIVLRFVHPCRFVPRFRSVRQCVHGAGIMAADMAVEAGTEEADIVVTVTATTTVTAINVC